MKKLVIFLILLGFSSVSMLAQDSNWVKQIIPFENGTISDIAFLDADKAWAVGQDYDDGRMVIMNTLDAGENWMLQIVPDENAFLSAIYMKSGEIGYATGTQYDKAIGVYTKNGGVNWMLQSIPDKVEFLDDMTFSEDGNVWSVGGGDSMAVILHLEDDSTWVQKFSLQGEGFFSSVDFVDTLHGWAAGSDWVTTFGSPLLARTIDGGQSWEMVDLPFETGILRAVSFINPDTGWVAGSADEGFVLLETQDGGNNWIFHEELEEEEIVSKIQSTSRFYGYSQITQLLFMIGILFLFGILSKRIYNDTGLDFTRFYLLSYPGRLIAYVIATFIGTLSLNLFVNSYALTASTQANEKEISYRNEGNLNPEDLYCYAYGDERTTEFGLAEPVIFTRKLKYSFLNKINIEPENIEINKGDSIILNVTGEDQYGDEMLIDDPLWSVDGGGRIEIIDDQLLFVSEESGEYTILCKDKYTGITGSTIIIINPLTFVTNEINADNFNVFRIIPNPADKEVNILFYAETGGDIYIRIVNSQEKDVYMLSQTVEEGVQSFKWDTAEVAEGMFYCIISIEGKRLVKPLTIIH